MFLLLALLLHGDASADLPCDDACRARSAAAADAALDAAAERATRSGYLYGYARWFLSATCRRGGGATTANATADAITRHCYARELRRLEKWAPTRRPKESGYTE
ncbi:hypothetical protein ACP4OV_019547 [Aristida adscensionis]